MMMVVRVAASLLRSQAIMVFSCGALMLGVSPAFAAVNDVDPVVVAAQAALADNDPAQAVQLLQAHPLVDNFGDVRMEYVRAAGVGGDGKRVLNLITSDSRAIDAGWPERYHGALWWWRGRASAMSAEDADDWNRVATCYATALELGANEVPSDQLLWCLADALASAGREALASRAALRVWHGWRDSVWRCDAGLLAARLAEKPADRLGLLRDIHGSEGIPARQRLLAADQLCVSLLDAMPLQCLGIAEAELEWLAQHNDSTPEAVVRFQRWKALALAKIDPQRGLTALAALPDSDSMVRAAHDQAQRALQRQQQDLLPALVAGGEVSWAALQDLARQDAVALAMVLARGESVDAYLSEPVVESDLGHLVVAEALARHGDQALAAAHVDQVQQPWRIVVDDRRLVELLPQAAGRLMLVAASVATDAQRAQGGWAWLREHERNAEASGIAWVQQAQQAEQADAAHAAWICAAERLPAAHLWAAEAAVRATDPWLKDAEVSPEQLERAMGLLTASAWASDSQAALQARFRLAKVLMRLDMRIDARQCLESLRSHGDARQRQVVDALLAHLDVQKEE